jgi:hypothetical protein
VTGTPYFFQGKPLIRGGKPAMNERCCCVDECCCGPCIRFRFEVSGLTDGGDCAGCVDANDTYITGEVNPVITDGVCVYEVDITPDPNPLSACDDPTFSLKAKITCPVEGGIRVEASVQIGLIIAPSPAPGEPSLAGVPHFILDEVYATCDDFSEALARSGTTSNICGIADATVTLSVDPCISPLAYLDPDGVPYESPGGDNYLAPNTASVPLRAPKQPRPPKQKRKRERKVKVELPVCQHRGEELGKADCQCAGKPVVWHCTLLDQPCIAQTVGKPITKAGSTRISSPVACSLCEHFEAL